MNKLENIKRKLENREPVIGALVSMTDCTVSERLAFAGYDFLWIDAEHNGLDYNNIMMHLIAASSGGAASFVRVRENDPALVKPILDMGPDGIIFPLIRTVEDAKLAVSSCIYPPDGIRGMGPGRAVRYGVDNGAEYIKQSRSKIWKILQVEHIECVNNLEKIVAIDGVDALMIGPYDLSGSIGLLGQTEHPEVQKLIDRICEIAIRAGKYVGAFSGSNPSTIAGFINRGVSWIAVGGDGGFMMSGARKSLQSSREIFTNCTKKANNI